MSCLVKIPRKRPTQVKKGARKPSLQWLPMSITVLLLLSRQQGHVDAMRAKTRMPSFVRYQLRSKVCARILTPSWSIVMMIVTHRGYSCDIVPHRTVVVNYRDQNVLNSYRSRGPSAQHRTGIFRYCFWSTNAHDWPRYHASWDIVANRSPNRDSVTGALRVEGLHKLSSSQIIYFIKVKV